MLKAKLSKTDLIAVTVFVLSAIFLLWKANLGYVFNDEPFMITLGHRLIKGDRLLINEYNTTQLIGLFYVPFIYLFVTLTKSTAGIILFLRYIYVFWWIFTSVILYLRVRQYGKICLAVILFYLMFTPLDEMSLTYNVMALSSIVLFSSYFLVKGSRVKDYIAGVFLSMAVVAYPYLAILYFVWALSVILCNTVLKKRFVKTYRIFNLQKFLRITAVCAVCACLLVAFLLSGGIGNVFSSLKEVLSGGAPPKSIISLFIDMKIELKIIAVIGFAVFLFSVLDRRRNKRRELYFSVQTILFCCAVLIIVQKYFLLYNVIMFPISLLGLQAFVLTKNKNRLVFLTFGITGIVYSYATLVSSDTKWLAFATGSTPLGIAALIFIYEFYKETDKNNLKIKFVSTVCLCAVISFQLCGQCYIRAERNYLDKTSGELNTVINSGAAKGIITDSNNANMYEAVYADVEKMRKITGENKNLNFLSLSLFPSIYLDMDYQYGTFSSWTYFQNAENFPKTNERLKKYYRDNPDKDPDCIYILNDDLDMLETLDFTDFSKYKRIEIKSGTVFIK